MPAISAGIGDEALGVLLTDQNVGRYTTMSRSADTA